VIYPTVEMILSFKLKFLCHSEGGTTEESILKKYLL